MSPSLFFTYLFKKKQLMGTGKSKHLCIAVQHLIPTFSLFDPQIVIFTNSTNKQEMAMMLEFAYACLQAHWSVWSLPFSTAWAQSLSNKWDC